jgi:hypothetical protein
LLVKSFFILIISLILKKIYNSFFNVDYLIKTKSIYKTSSRGDRGSDMVIGGDNSIIFNTLI